MDIEYIYPMLKYSLDNNSSSFHLCLLFSYNYLCSECKIYLRGNNDLLRSGHSRQGIGQEFFSLCNVRLLIYRQSTTYILHSQYPSNTIHYNLNTSQSYYFHNKTNIQLNPHKLYQYNLYTNQKPKYQHYIQYKSTHQHKLNNQSDIVSNDQHKNNTHLNMMCKLFHQYTLHILQGMQYIGHSLLLSNNIQEHILSSYHCLHRFCNLRGRYNISCFFCNSYFGIICSIHWSLLRSILCLICICLKTRMNKSW